MSPSPLPPLGRAQSHAARRVVPALLVTAVLGYAGCGGGSSFASQADSICKTYNAKAEAVPQPTSASELSGYLDQVTPLFAQGVAKLAALKPPSGKSAQFQQWISTAQQEVSAVQQAQSAAHSGNVNQAASIVQQAGPLASQAKSEAKALGLTVCGK